MDKDSKIKEYLHQLNTKGGINGKDLINEGVTTLSNGKVVYEFDEYIVFLSDNIMYLLSMENGITYFNVLTAQLIMLDVFVFINYCLKENIDPENEVKDVLTTLEELEYYEFAKSVLEIWDNYNILK